MGGKADEDECPPESRTKTILSQGEKDKLGRCNKNTQNTQKKTNWLILSIQWFGGWTVLRGFAVLNFVTPSFTECPERMGSTIQVLEIQEWNPAKHEGDSDRFLPDMGAARISCPISPQ